MESSFELRPADLRANELRYEIKVRGQIPAVTIDQCRSQLLGMIYRKVVSIGSPYSFDEDCEGIGDSLYNIRETLEECCVPLTMIRCQKLKSRLAHVENRLHLLLPVDETQRTMKSKFMIEVSSLIGKVIEKQLVLSSNDQITVRADTLKPLSLFPLVEESLTCTGVEVNQHSDCACSGQMNDKFGSINVFQNFSTPIREQEYIAIDECDNSLDSKMGGLLLSEGGPRTGHSTNPFMYELAEPIMELSPIFRKENESSNPFYKDDLGNFKGFAPNQVQYRSEDKGSRVPVYKWDVKFSGTKGGQSVIAFIERVRELRIARGVTFEQLFDGAVDLFKEPALSWFRNIRDTISSWFELERRVIDTFVPPNYDEMLLDEIKARKQLTSESFTTYINLIRMKFSYLLVPVPVYYQISIIRRNLVQSIVQQLSLVEIYSYEDLEKYCRLIEKNSPSLLQTDKERRVTRKPEDEGLYAFTGEDKGKVRDKAAGDPNTRKSLTCWNCRAKGHIAADCRKRRALSCFGCGLPGVMISDCPRCRSNPKLNYRSENRQGGSPQDATVLPLPSHPQEGAETGL